MKCLMKNYRTLNRNVLEKLSILTAVLKMEKCVDCILCLHIQKSIFLINFRIKIIIINFYSPGPGLSSTSPDITRQDWI